MVLVVFTKQAKNASADFIWSKLAHYSDMSWHPSIKTSRNVGSIVDGSDSMVGAKRILVGEPDNKELIETVREWNEEKKYLKLSIDKGGPPFAKTLTVSFRVREVREEGQEIVLVDVIVDVDLKTPFLCLAPLVKVVIRKKLGGLVDGIADLKEPAKVSNAPPTEANA